MNNKLTFDILGLTENKSRLKSDDKFYFHKYPIRKKSFISFSKSTLIPQSKVAEWLSVSLRTLQRYPENKILDSNVSEKLFLLADLYSKGIEIMGRDKFNLWLESELKVLENKKPSDYLRYYTGIQLINDLLGRIEYGVYS